MTIEVANDEIGGDWHVSETECPGPYLTGRVDEIAAEVNRRLAGE